MKPHPHIFPGMKIKPGTSAMEILRELISTLAPLDNGIAIGSSHEGEEDKQSGSKGILTRYICTYVHASLDCSRNYGLQICEPDLTAVAFYRREQNDLLN